MGRMGGMSYNSRVRAETEGKAIFERSPTPTGITPHNELATTATMDHGMESFYS